MIYLYHALSFLLLPIYFIIILIRILKGKEDISRIKERFGYGAFLTSKDKKIIWLHAASVGESVIALTLIEHLTPLIPQSYFLVTTGTKSSAEILKKKLPANAIHQFLPIDNIIFVKRFLSYWRPSLGIFIESELWPCLVAESSKYCKLLLLNARLSDKSFKFWSKAKFFFRLITNNFSKIIVQSDLDLHKFHSLGASNLINLGNIKFANKKLPVNLTELALLKNHFNTKRIIVFASTHKEDEEEIFSIIKILKSYHPDYYFILIPRHPGRIPDIINICNSLNLEYQIKSETLPILTKDIYIIDKFGELGLYFSLAYISFIGGSFKQGGHNILESACFGNCILFGPDMSHNADLMHNILQDQAAIQIKDKDELLEKLQYLGTQEGGKQVHIYQENALKFMRKNDHILDSYLSVIMTTLS